MTKALEDRLEWFFYGTVLTTLLLSGVFVYIGFTLDEQDWLTLALSVWLGGSLLSFLPWIYSICRRKDRGRSQLLQFGIVFYLNVCLTTLLAPAVVMVRTGARDMPTVNQFKLLGLAFHDYAENQGLGRFPPAALRDKVGEPLLSWRVAILPYIEQEALYNRFRLDESWDSPHNIELLDEMPAVYRPLHPAKCLPGTTRFQVFVGPGTPFEIAEGPRRKEDFPDGLPKTILVVEAHDPVPWTKPADLTYHPEQPLPELGWRGTPRSNSLFGRERHWFPALLADGSVRTFCFEVERGEREVRQVIVRNDGKGWDDW